jgi:hypothetical protein
LKKLLHLLLTALILGALAWALWRGLTHRREENAAAANHETPAGEETPPESFVVKLEKEQVEALDLDKAKPEKTELRPQRIAFGRVLDPTPIVTLDGELAAAEAALAASRAENERTQKLLAAGETASRKAAEAAEAQFRSDEIKADGLRRRALLEWGAFFSALDAAARREFVERLVHGSSALVRVDLLPGDALADPPKSARLLVLGREEEPLITNSLTPATDVDPKTQAQGFILRIDNPPFPLRPGMALSAWLELPENPRAGFALPRSAILRHDGRAWVFVQEEEGKFVRKPVQLEAPLEADKGWFTAAEGGGIDADDLIIVKGAQALLSEELKAQGGGGAEE